MKANEALKEPDAMERASKEFSRMQLWRWSTGKTQPSKVNCVKLAHVLQLEISFENGEFNFWRKDG